MPTGLIKRLREFFFFLWSSLLFFFPFPFSRLEVGRIAVLDAGPSVQARKGTPKKILLDPSKVVVASSALPCVMQGLPTTILP